MNAEQLSIYAEINAEGIRAISMLVANQAAQVAGKPLIYESHDFTLIANQLDYLASRARNT